MSSGIPAAPELPGWRHVYSGKVRDLYVPIDPLGSQARSGDPVDVASPAAQSVDAQEVPDRVLVVASDRLSAYDHVLSTEIPDKGAILTQLSLWWFGQLQVPHHVLGTTEAQGVPAQVAGRAMVCKNLQMYPIECIARGYLTGSGLVEYRKSQTVCGLPLPAGLVDGSRLEAPIFTPSAKAAVGEHDENIDFAAVVERVGPETAEALRDTTLRVYSQAEEIARERGIILADTKVEFGLDADGVLTLGDEVLTPDSSRFWDATLWQPGQAQASFDKQYVRDWLVSPASGWDRSGGAEPPALPADVVERTRQRYVEAFERLTGTQF
ncbi:phosphoribosylaminoimidazolesuccinocarboxamide synthase [Psychromicrobium xiongbiense]|uniref:phosphoribosylaminoimidazolesuccinocarboxamide synthase n=1 Tax=Psychromicrobium xiongbiense TaxID=3051184 RepID=UPI00255788A9|nr:phosphoribosylaminoimidazolesuccinocarboxamide synthase [Psychromicrobium sp. YIM S02556]